MGNKEGTAQPSNLRIRNSVTDAQQPNTLTVDVTQVDAQLGSWIRPLHQGRCNFVLEVFSRNTGFGVFGIR